MFSFNRRKTQLDVQQHIRRIVDRSSPNLTLGGENVRGESRSNRTIPVLLCPGDLDGPQLERAIPALTKDFSGNGVSVIVNQSWDSQQITVVFCVEGRLKCFRGEVRANRPFGAGFWQLGIELLELLERDDRIPRQDVSGFVALLDPAAAPGNCLTK